MSRTKSPLINFTRLSPNNNKPRNSQIRRLTPHCVAGNLTVEAILGLARFSNYDSTNGASCNYAIGSDGRVGLGVEETNRSWCTSSSINDNQAITFEIANNGPGPDWSMSEEAINKFLDMSVDIAKAYGFKKIAYKDKPSNIQSSQIELWIKTWAPENAMVITLHSWYANKACPGPYLIRQLPWLVGEMNKRLNGNASEKFVREGATPPKEIIPPFESTNTINEFKPYLAKIMVSALNIRKGPDVNSSVVKTLVNDKNSYTIIEEAEGPGAAMWCKLKSGLGWVSKDFISKK